ncbi:polysialyltransferase family glycosyltransferase [Anabaena sp. CCY 0017]|uniref:polysialyltransferase family glycosyltransferase n=1 Tax=Anabaena sp. CCY 0017 TaxID=3103866 RepID=UPI0039C6CD8A
MNRLIVANGTWQLIVVISALSQVSNHTSSVFDDYLLLYAPGLSNGMKKVMMEIASLAWTWQKIIWVDDLLYSNIITYSNFEILELLQAIKEKIGINIFPEIWIGKLTDPAEKLILESFPNAEISIYEDGLHTYVPQEDWRLNHLQLIFKPGVAKYKIQKRIQNTNISHRLKNYGLCRQHIDRLTRSYLLLNNILPVPQYLDCKIIKIHNEFILLTIQKIRASIKLDFYKQIISKSQNYVLVTGQCFARWGLMSWEQELNMYYKIFNTLQENNLTPLWKEHPRINKPFFKELATQFQELHPIEFNLPIYWPIEMFIEDINLIACVSATSTSLFYVRDIFGLQSYTVAHELSHLFSGDFAYITELVAKHIPQIDLMPQMFKESIRIS